MHLEDQINQMNLVLAEQGQSIESLSEIITVLKKRLKSLDEGNREDGRMSFNSGGLSEMPPDGANR